jgi:multidrug efflux pump subunit AcrB
MSDTRHTGSLSVNHQRQFPAVKLTFNLPQGVALGQSVAAINRAQSELGAPPSLTGSFTGNAQAFQSSLASEPCWSRELYPPFYHPLDVAVRGSRGVAGIMGGGLRPVIGMIGIILLIGIVKKNGIMPERAIA